MVFRIKCESLKELLAAAGVQPLDIAKRLGLCKASVSMKLNGERPWWEDEIGPIATAINKTGRAKVDEAKLIRFIGKEHIRRRGTLA